MTSFTESHLSEKSTNSGEEGAARLGPSAAVCYLFLENCLPDAGLVGTFAKLRFCNGGKPFFDQVFGNGGDPWKNSVSDVLRFRFASGLKPHEGQQK